ncbi:Disease resistance protein (TIR-NBS class) [Rhynchospora pubera]|uniref:Disease resistance protein (TIR-NBS class) n=1 Tax=Rhynchospora pubera TaxID=906938 RepID=A0AAV8CXP8_9POAL|nr:Disease resistance protein (TIR-NBS class) [Rhynchospora pubera]
MELDKESSHPGAFLSSASRNLSSSSSAFVSASQTPFFSPRSPPPLIPPQITIIPSQVTVSPSDVSPCHASSSSTSVVRQRNKKTKKKSSPVSICTRPVLKVSSTNRPRSYDVYLAYHGRKLSLLRFVNWLRAELEAQGISCFACDRARCRSSRSQSHVEKIMNFATFGVVVITKKSFGNPYTIEELRNFFGRRNLVPIYFDLGPSDCLARDIVERRGDLWEKHGGELWILYGGLEREWREAVEALSRVLDLQLEAGSGNWRDCILETVSVLAKKLGRRSVVDRINRWREKVERNEFPYPRNENFVGRKKELSELELILFGYVSGDAEREYFELKTRQRRIITGTSTNKCESWSEYGGKGKEPVVWRESEKEIEMQRQVRGKAASRIARRKRPKAKILYGKGIACVSGESGIGKTELVLEYAYRFSQRYKMVLWVGGQSRYIRQNFLNLRNLLEIDLGCESYSHEKGNFKCFEEQEEEAIARVRKELSSDIPFLVIIDDLESETDWWDRRVITELIPHLGGETHFIITTRLPKVLCLEPMKLSYLSGVEAMALMRGETLAKDYPLVESDALRAIEEKLGRLTLGLGIIGAILSELPITPSRLLDTINRMPLRDLPWTDKEESLTFKRHATLIQLLDVCLSIFDHADGPHSLAARMVHVSGWFASSPVPVHLLALAAYRFPKKKRGSSVFKKWSRLLRRSRIKRSESEAASMLVRFGVARICTRPNCIQFHELLKIYARRRGSHRVAQAVVQSICVRASISHSLDHLWAACFLVFGSGSEHVTVELNPTELTHFVRQVGLPLAIHTFITFSRCNAGLELLRLCTDALESAGEVLVNSRGDKWRLKRKLGSCFRDDSSRSDEGFRLLWQEITLLKATVLETRAKLMLRGGRYDIGDDLIRKAIFIRSSICGDRHPDTLSARETLSRLTRLLTNVQIS